MEILDKKDGKTFASMKNVSQEVEKTISFEEKVQNFLKESTENLRQIQKQQDKKRGLMKKKTNKNK